MVMARQRRVRKPFGARIVDVIIYAVMWFVIAITLYPFIYIVSSSISNPEAVLAQEVWLFPKGFSLRSYRLILNDSSIWRAYYNTIWYTAVGTAISLALTLIGGYALSRRYLTGRSFFMIFIAITMFFSGGLIPLFILVIKLGLYNTRWAIVLPVAINTWHLIIARVYFQSSIPDSLPEAAKIDGCNDIGIFLRIVLPISAPIIAVISLYSAVAHWNSYFSALIYLPDSRLHPLTMLLRSILIQNQMMATMAELEEGQLEALMYALQVKYSVIVITILPIICLYPFLQKHFVKGVMIGALKE